MQKQVAAWQIEANRQGELNKIEKIEQDAREEELVEKKDRLETEINEL